MVGLSIHDMNRSLLKKYDVFLVIVVLFLFVCLLNEFVLVLHLQCSVSESVCEDRISNCREYGGPEVCMKPSYQSWAKNNCPKYCGLCYTFNYVTGVPVGKEK